MTLPVVWADTDIATTLYNSFVKTVEKVSSFPVNLHHIEDATLQFQDLFALPKTVGNHIYKMWVQTESTYIC